MGTNVVRASTVANNNVDLDKLFQIESSFVADAENKGSGARGLGQVTPAALTEWNQYNPDDTHKPDDLFMSNVNAKISGWYVNKRVPDMLKAFGIPDTTDNRLASYNAGVGTLKQVLAGKKPLPAETRDYIKKYHSSPVMGQPK